MDESDRRFFFLLFFFQRRNFNQIIEERKAYFLSIGNKSGAKFENFFPFFFNEFQSKISSFSDGSIFVIIICKYICICIVKFIGKVYR